MTGGEPDRGPRAGRRPPSTLPREVVDELRQVARPGRIDEVQDLVEAAVQAFEEQDYASALGPAMRAKQAAPRSPAVREILGLAYYRLGRFRDAARELGAYRRMTDRRDQDHVLADCERALGKPARALELLDGVTLSEVGEETLVEGFIVAAGALEDLGRLDEAVELLQRGPRPREIRPYHLRLWYVLADALERAGRRSDARSWWDLIYAEDPEFFDVASRRLRA